MAISGAPSLIELFVPDKVDPNLVNPEISIVVPALNEELTIGEFIDWCWKGLSDAGVAGEIIIVDSSSDDTPNIALSKGAKVLRTPKRGLGQAYIDSIPYIQGKFVIMGDCDLTYDFRDLRFFVDSYLNGSEYVMGSRFKGFIEDNAMPKLHRYFGTPLTTWILNRIYSSKFSDIHCGMRGITKNALIKINLSSTGWEYASEMVLKAKRYGLVIDEVPVKFYKDREGRFSHHRRAGFWSPWYAGWVNLKVMLTYGSEMLLIKPGVLMAIFGLLISFLCTLGGVTVLGVGFNTYMHLLGVVLFTLGLSIFQVGLLGGDFHGMPEKYERIRKISDLSYNNGMLIAFGSIFFGLLLEIGFVVDYIQNGFEAKNFGHGAINGFLLLITGVQIFSFVLLLELKRRR